MTEAFDLIFDVIAGVVAWFYALWPSYGFAIVMLTLTVMIVVTPLTLKGTRSMLQMQLLQPELKRIQKKYGPGERQQMNEELMAFYQEHGINPLGGCIPLLVQLPVFLVLFRVVQGMTRRATDIGTQLGWTARRDVTTGPFDSETLDRTGHPFDPEFIPTDSVLYEDLTSSNEMLWLGIDLSRSASSVISDGFVDVLPYLVLIVIVLFSGLYQHRQIQSRNTGAQINPQQQAIMRVMPYFLPVFSWAMPAALVVYFVVSNLYRIGQQGYITHSLYGGDDSPGAELAKRRSSDDDATPAKSDGKTEGKGRPTPKRNEARGGRAAGSARAKSSRNRGRSGARSRSGSTRSGGQARGKGAKAGDGKGAKAGRSKGAKAGDGKGAKAGRSKGGDGKAGQGTKAGRSKGGDGKAGQGTKGSKSAQSPSTRGSGAGRTGRAPTRHGGGRTTDPGSPQNRKKKGK